LWIIFIVPAFMDFLSDSEDVCIGNSIFGALELEKAYKLGFKESAHKVLNFIKNTDIPDSELCTEETILGGASPPVLMRPIPYTHGESGIAREGHSHQVGLLNDGELVDRLSRGKGSQRALSHSRGRLTHDRSADLATHSQGVLGCVGKSIGETGLSDLDFAATRERAGNTLVDS
jgi:hypothetical protein